MTRARWAPSFALVLPADVDDFLRKHIDSIEGLEILLLVAREPDGEHVASACADRLGVSPPVCARQLALLAGSGLLAATPTGFRYAPKTAELGARVRRLVEVYAARRLEVVNAIIGRSLDRIRELADAFRLKKEK